jgi:hypothetical protein
MGPVEGHRIGPAAARDFQTSSAIPIKRRAEWGRKKPAAPSQISIAVLAFTALIYYT